MPTDAELAILQVLWRRGPSSVRDIWTDLDSRWGYTTVLKFLQIMLEKELVSRDERTFRHIYRAAAAERRTQERIVGSVAERVFAGSTSELVLRALSARPVSEDELKKIRSLLDEAERKQT
ncbi:MAG TPA: BlaI/MecI/CopY family transcriptional regulator [Opitutaceae bacterium]|jgi:predicted transcriptional regulator